MTNIPPTVRELHDTRRTILKVAHLLFREHGYRMVSTRQIATACGLTQPALYRHFATKQELYVEVLVEALQQLHIQIAAIVAQDADIVLRLRQVTHILPGAWEDASQMFHDITHELDLKQREKVAGLFAQNIVAPIASLFAQGMAQGLLRSVQQGGLDATEATFVLLRMLDDHGTTRSRIRTTERHADLMLDILLHGLFQPTQALS